MPPFIYINGYPGVGKLTVAKELWYVPTWPCTLIHAEPLTLGPMV